MDREKYAACGQDLFAMAIAGSNGIFVDIGSADPTHNNNTYLLEKNGWKGICVEYNSEHNHKYSSRQNSSYINFDATLLNYKEIFTRLEYPPTIDYLSLDVDENTNSMFRVIPFDDYKFRCITIEHDAYLAGPAPREFQRYVLTQRGYFLLFGNIFVEGLSDHGPNEAFEDWWVHPAFFQYDMEKLNNMKRENLYPSEAIEILERNK